MGVQGTGRRLVAAVLVSAAVLAVLAVSTHAEVLAVLAVSTQGGVAAVLAILAVLSVASTSDGSVITTSNAVHDSEFYIRSLDFFYANGEEETRGEEKEGDRRVRKSEGGEISLCPCLYYRKVHCPVMGEHTGPIDVLLVFGERNIFWTRLRTCLCRSRRRAYMTP